MLLLREEPRHGWDVRSSLLARGFNPDVSALYRNLRTMEAKRLIVSRWSGSSSAGPKRRVYELTDAGRQELERRAAVLATARRAHSAFLSDYRKGARPSSS